MLKIPCFCDCDKNILQCYDSTLPRSNETFPLKRDETDQILSNALVIINIQQIAVCC